MGLCYIIASLSIYDEYSNDILDMPEGSCFPRFYSSTPVFSFNMLAFSILLTLIVFLVTSELLILTGHGTERRLRRCKLALVQLLSRGLTLSVILPLELGQLRLL